MTNQPSDFKPSPPRWKIWTAAIVGSLAAAVFTISRGISSKGDFADPEEHLASAIGGGIAVALLVCLVTYFLVFRQSPKRAMWLAFTTFIAAGTIGGIISTNI